MQKIVQQSIKICLFLGLFFFSCNLSFSFSFEDKYFNANVFMYTDLMLKDDKIESKFLNAVKEEDVKTAEMLLKQKPKIVNTNKIHVTPLDIAVLNGNKELVKLLIDNGADVNKKNIFKKTAILYLGQGDRLECAKLLIDAGADLNVKNEQGKNPLYMAVYNEDLDLLKLLIQSGARVENNKIELYTDEKINISELAEMTGNEEIIKIIKENLDRK